MATDVASLAIKVESLKVSEADGRLKNLASSGGSAERATSGLTGAFTKLIGPLTAAVSATAALTKVVAIQRQFDVLNAGLITATGSSKEAGVAFEALREFAANTPYSLDQAVQGFTKLVNLGLTPSERALNSYGNTASAMGKDLSQMVEAVADAATGEFERLKEFGIKAKQQGNSVSLTFQGVTTTIGNNAASIEEYLTKIGENQFAGAMQQRMDSLDGAMSNLGDAWDQLFLTVSQAGVGDVVEKAVKLATDAIQELTAMLASGEIGAYLESITGQFKNWGEDVENLVILLTTVFRDNTKKWDDDVEASVDFMIGAFKNLPSNVRAFIQIMTVEVASGFDKAYAYAGAFADGVKAIFNDSTMAGVGRALDAQLAGIQQARMDSIDTALQERNVTVKASEDQVAAAKRLRAAYDAKAAARKAGAAGTDRLAGYRIGGNSKGSKSSDKVDKSVEAARKARESEFNSVVEGLRSQEEAIQASYDKRRAIIEANTSSESAQRKDLMTRLDADRTEQLAKLEEQNGAEVEGLRSSLRTQEEAIQESYDKRMKIIEANTAEGSTLRDQLEARTAADREKALTELEVQKQRERDSLYNSLLTEEEMLTQAYERKKTLILESESVTELERQDLLRRLKKQFDDETAASEQTRINAQLTNASSLFGGLADLAKSYAGEQSGAYKALFAVSKAFSLTQAAMSIATGLAKAQELGFPANLAAMAQVAAQGASALSTIRGSNYSGAYDQGGQIPAGKIGIVGEYGPEVVRGPASVTGRKATERLMGGSGSDSAPAASPITNLRIVNAFDTGVVGDYMGSDTGEEIIMNAVRRNQSTIRSMASGG